MHAVTLKLGSWLTGTGGDDPPSDFPLFSSLAADMLEHTVLVDGLKRRLAVGTIKEDESKRLWRILVWKSKRDMGRSLSFGVWTDTFGIVRGDLDVGYSGSAEHKDRSTNYIQTAAFAEGLSAEVLHLHLDSADGMCPE